MALVTSAEAPLPTPAFVCVAVTALLLWAYLIVLGLAAAMSGGAAGLGDAFAILDNPAVPASFGAGMVVTALKMLVLLVMTTLVVVQRVRGDTRLERGVMRAAIRVVIALTVLSLLLPLVDLGGGGANAMSGLVTLTSTLPVTLFGMAVLLVADRALARPEPDVF